MTTVYCDKLFFAAVFIRIEAINYPLQTQRWNVGRNSFREIRRTIKDIHYSSKDNLPIVKLSFSQWISNNISGNVFSIFRFS